MSIYRTIIKQAWSITWRIKYLWFFGLFALLALVGNEGELQLIFRMFSFDPSKPLLPWLTETGLFTKGGLLNAFGLFSKDFPQMITLLFTWLLILALVIFVVWLINISLGALINNVALILSNKKSNFEEGIKVGMEKFWMIFSYNLLLKVLMFLMFAPFVFVALRSESVFSNIFYVILFVVFVPMAMGVAFIIRYAMAYIVIKNKRFKEALVSGWQLFIKNWIVTIEFAILLFFINIGVIISYFILLLFLTTPYQKMLVIAYKIFSISGFWVVAVGAPIMLILFTALMGAVFAVFQITSWTNLFVLLEGKGGTSKIVRFFNRDK